MSDSEAKRLARYARYNSTSGGYARRRRYEDKHPERKVRWSRITGREVAAGKIAPMAPVWPEGEQP